MPISERDVANAERMIDLYPGRRGYFDGLMTDLEAWEIAGAADPSAAIDAYAARLVEHIAGLGDHSEVGGYPGYWVEMAKEFEEAWQQGGFSDGAIREVTFKLIKGDRFFSNNPLKYLVYAVFKRKNVVIDEIEAMGAHFQTRIQSQDLDLLDYLADQSDEMYIKRPIDSLVERARYGLGGVLRVPGGRLAEFLNTDKGHQLGVFGAVDWFCDGRYGRILKPMLSEYRNDPEYRGYSEDPMGYCQGALERFLAG
ncbi:MAG: hypothetical protein A2784_04790 [Candidatus Chisholmbacteria bacterium RIFCSPHIGHO2_01_FULL_48_12]|uniref:Uncharacterized protein n=1 Tax=Candidatus Chisholmbacteria bacterium RIFCSPHIGHO2_01_FULL_48_12 TaxID=1797589 RepID=A0A1G1VMM8_9BACT|nr:MAG: hypothetical protein A2784_04790 [Candidatus Chisholmbacteria bacterium RIFCSPHIGHO2_01_FULL_48_12]